MPGSTIEELRFIFRPTYIGANYLYLIQASKFIVPFAVYMETANLGAGMHIRNRRTETS